MLQDISGRRLRDLSDLIAMQIASRGNLTTPERQTKHLKDFLRYFVITQDEHDADNPFKRMPYDDMPHLGYLAELWVNEQLLVIAKSRQLLCTWLWCAVLLWDTMFKDGRLNIIINKREDDADETIDRMRFIYDNLPGAMQAAIPADRTPQGQLGSYCKLSFSQHNSLIRGLPQNPDAVRKNTASNLFIDEAAFIERAAECYTAALPTIRGGGKLILNSTPKGQNFFAKLFQDLGDDIG